jgi:hypothetical protein
VGIVYGGLDHQVMLRGSGEWQVGEEAGQGRGRQTRAAVAEAAGDRYVRKSYSRRSGMFAVVWAAVVVKSARVKSARARERERERERAFVYVTSK